MKDKESSKQRKWEGVILVKVWLGASTGGKHCLVSTGSHSESRQAHTRILHLTWCWIQRGCNVTCQIQSQTLSAVLLSVWLLLFGYQLVSDSFMTPWTPHDSMPVSSVYGFSRQEYWSRLKFLFPRDLPDPCLLYWQVDLVPLSHQGSPCVPMKDCRSLLWGSGGIVKGMKQWLSFPCKQLCSLILDGLSSVESPLSEKTQ